MTEKTDNISSLIIEQFKTLHADNAALRNEVVQTRQDLKQDFRLLGLRMDTMEQHMAALVIGSRYQGERIATLETRLERLERRAGLIDG